MSYQRIVADAFSRIPPFNFLRSPIATTDIPAGTTGQVLTTSGSTVTWATIANANVSASAAITAGKLAATPGCRAYNSANISHTTSGATQFLTFDSERFDVDTMHSTSSNTGRITLTTAGRYHVIGNASFAANATGQRGLNIRINGTTFIATVFVDASAVGSTDLVVATIYQFAAADYVELGAYQSSGGNLNVTSFGNDTPEFMASYLSA